MEYINKNWLYYQGDIDDGPNKLYRMSLDGQVRQRLIDDEVDYFILQGEWIYCIIYEDSEDMELGGKIYKMHLDGTYKSRLCEKRALYFTVNGDRILFNNQLEYNGYYIMDTNGNRLIHIDDDAFDIRIAGNYLIYASFSDDSKLVRYDLLNRKRIVLDNGQTEICNIYEDYICYILKNQNYHYDGSVDGISTLYRIKIDGSEKLIIDSGNFGETHIIRDFLYFVDLSRTNVHPIYSGNIRKIDLSNNETYTVNHSKSSNLYFERDWIIYEKKAWFNRRTVFRGICKVKMDGTGYSVLVKGCCNIYDVYDGWVYYKILGEQVNTSTFKVYLRKIMIDGTEDTYLQTFEVNNYRSISSGNL